MSQGCDRWMNTTVLHRIPTRLARAAASWTSIGSLGHDRHDVPVLEAADKPNVVILLADDLGVQDIGYYHGPVETPVLDGLAKRGVGLKPFTRAAVCSPSGDTLLTGRHHVRTGVYSWISDGSNTPFTLAGKDDC